MRKDWPQYEEMPVKNISGARVKPKQLKWDCESRHYDDMHAVKVKKVTEIAD